MCIILYINLLLFVDEVMFGEVVSEPPQITAKPRKATDVIGKVYSFGLANYTIYKI